jgi:hypothetical protein
MLCTTVGPSPLSEQRHSRDVPSFVVASLESILTVRLGSKKLASAAHAYCMTHNWAVTKQLAVMFSASSFGCSAMQMARRVTIELTLTSGLPTVPINRFLVLDWHNCRGEDGPGHCALRQKDALRRLREFPNSMPHSRHKEYISCI